MQTRHAGVKNEFEQMHHMDANGYELDLPSGAYTDLIGNGNDDERGTTSQTDIDMKEPAAEGVHTETDYSAQASTSHGLLQPEDDEMDELDDPSKQLFLRRQPRRFAHTKSFSNGVADRATADWLKEHFHTKRGSLVPKGFLCDRYEEFCLSTGRKPMNNATLGRFIRGVFRGLETRRLGARQQSRYFYNNLGVRPTSKFVQLMLKEKRPSYVRRPQNKNSLKDGNNELQDQQDTPNDRTAIAVPLYLPNFMLRRLESARAAYLERNWKESLNEVLVKMDKDGYQVIVATAVQHESRILEISSEIDAEARYWLTEVDRTGESVVSGKLAPFFSAFSCHLKKLCRAILIFDLDQIPTVMKDFWSTGSSSDAVVDYNLNQLVSWPPLQQFIAKIYRKYHAKLLDVLLPYESHCIASCHDYVWCTLHVIAVNYGNLVESVASDYSSGFRRILSCEAFAFCADLRERLSWNYTVTYVRQVTSTGSFHALLKRVFCEVFDAASTADVLFSVVGSLAIFEEGLQRFCDTDSDNIPASCVKWFTELVQPVILEGDDNGVSLQKLHHIRTTWTIFLALFSDSLAPFEGDVHIKEGVFAFLRLAVNRIVSGLEEIMLLKTSLDYYAEKFCWDGRDDISTITCNIQWWPEFIRNTFDQCAVTLPEEAETSVAENITSGDAQSPSDQSAMLHDDQSVEVKYSDTCPSCTVRVSGRGTKGRNRWLEET